MVQRDKIVAALEGKPLLVDFMWIESHNCGCAVGQLLVSAGVDPKQLAGRRGPDRDEIELLEREYGLVRGSYLELMEHNDNIWGTKEERSQRLIFRIKQGEVV